MPHRKTFIIGGIIFVIIAVIGGGVWWYMQGEDRTLENIFSFGETPQEQERPGGGDAAPGGDNTVSTSTPGQSGPPLLYQLHGKPVAGMTAFEKETNGTTTVAARYVERDVGHIYETTFPSRTKARASNETVQGVHRAVWGNGGSMVAMQTLTENDLIGTYAIALPDDPFATSSEDTQEGVFLPDHIESISAEGSDSSRLFALRVENGSAEGQLMSFSNTGRQTIFSSPLTEWNAQWVDNNTIALTTKPSYLTEGQLYFLDPRTGATELILDGRTGLTALPQANTARVLYGQTVGNQPSFLQVYNTDTRDGIQIPLRTLPEKCTWSTQEETVLYCAVPNNIPGAQYPDAWYQGRVNFSDTLYRIDLETNTRQPIAQLTSRASPMDATQLELGPNEEYLFFIDKRSGTPWRVYLGQ